jgi:hypothetical protein
MSSPQEREPMYEDVDYSEEEYRQDPEEDGSAIFDLPEETLEKGDSDEDLGSDLSCQEDDGSSEPELDWSSDEPSLSGHENNGNLPEVIIQLQKQLLNNYTLPPCPDGLPLEYTLSQAERLSLQHYLAWTESHGTVKAYNSHARVLAEATGEDILSLYKVRKLASDLTGLKQSFVDMCPKAAWLLLESLRLNPLAHTAIMAKSVENHIIYWHRVLELNQSLKQQCSTCPSFQSSRHIIPMQKLPMTCVIEIIAYSRHWMH